MSKRILLFLATNLAIVLVLSILAALLGLDGRAWSSDGTPMFGQLFLFCLFWGMGGALISLQLSRWIAKRAVGAQVVDGHTGDANLDWLHTTVGNLARQANLPMPEVAVYPSTEVNAFATGPSKKRSLVAVSTGLLGAMGRNEVEAVLAHELGHIANGDMITMTLLQGVLNAFVLFFARLASIAVRIALKSRSSWAVSWVVRIVFQIALSLLASLITASYSRRREFRADAAAAALAGRTNMVAALKRLMTTTDRVDMSQPALATLKVAGGKSWMRAFATHPPLEARIAALEEMGY